MAFKTLKDIPVHGLELLDELAKLLPGDEPKNAPPTIQEPAKSRKRSTERVDLGRLDVEKYLSANNLDFNIKSQGGKTIYRLDVCLFNPAHTKNESAIIQDVRGLLTYQCFHDSCRHNTWADARSHISGDASLAQYHEKYNPDWKPPEKRKKKTTQDEEKKFISWTTQGRAIVNSARLANFIEGVFEPIFWEDVIDHFYTYEIDAGVWNDLATAAVRNLARRELGDVAKAHHIKEAVQLLKDQSYLSQKIIQSDPFMLNLENGMLDVRSLELSPHAPEFYSKVQMPVKYSKDASCDLWIRTLAQIFEDDLTKIDVLQQFFGYCLYPKIPFPCALFQIGGGGNGKGVVERIVGEILGTRNVSHISMARMQKDFGPIELKDVLLNSCGETETGALDVTNFKKIAAGDEIQAEVKYKNDVKFIPIAKHMISMNSFPGLREKTKSFFRRVVVLEYNQVFEGEDQDVNLADKLITELDGIFLWALEGLEMVLQNNSILVPDSVEDAKERFREATNPILLFIKEACVCGEDYHAAPPDLYKAYKDWADEAGVRKNRMLGKKSFYEQMRLNVTIQRKRLETREEWLGIGLIYDTANQCQLPDSS